MKGKYFEADEGVSKNDKGLFQKRFSEVSHNREDDSLKILITNHQLRDYSGSDIFTYVLADFLTRRGHNVTAYSKYLGKVASDLARLDIRIVDDLSEISKERFDIAHVHHNINALEIRYYFPKIPMVFLSHGVLPTLEKPPCFNIDLNHFLAVSEEVKSHLVSLGKVEHKIFVFRNIVDSEKFCPIKPIHKSATISSRFEQ